MSAYLRFGVAAGAAQPVNSYFGAGIVADGLIAGRPDDRLGVAISRAGISREAQRAYGLHSAEVSYELTYQMKVHETVAVQPDLQYVVHPSEHAGTPDALVFGLRLVLTAGYPKKAPAADATDPTVPPEGPQPTDENGGTANGD